MITALSVRGNKFVDQQNNVIRLIGANNIGTHYACLTNQAPNDPVFGGFPHDIATLKIMQSWGMNCVRVTLNAGCWLNCCVSPFTFGPTYQQAILAYIDSINAAGMYAIINLVNTASGTGEMADTSATNFWASIGPMIKNKPLILIEPYNEPHTILLWNTWLNGGTEGGLLSYSSIGMQSLINTIRATGCKQPILLDGMSYAGDFTGFIANIPTDPLNQLGASWHRYTDWPHTSATDIGSFFATIQSVAALYPITLTEFGGTANVAATVAFNQAYYMSLINFCDFFGLGYLIWSWSPGPAINILSDLIVDAPNTYATAFYQHLQLIAAGGKYSQRDTRQQIIPTLPF